jgi:glycosyltransferase involved in cell wall biosynthesis
MQEHPKEKIEISVVAPLYNEEKNLHEFFRELNDVLTADKKPFEIIFVNDGSTDSSEEVLRNIAEKNNHTQVVTLRKNTGKARSLEQGLKLARGDKVVILDADLQYDPGDIQALAAKIDEGYDVVSGKRVNRADPWSVVLTSWIFRRIIRLLSGLKLDDCFSGIKCFSSSAINYLRVYGDLNRVYIFYAYSAGFKVCEIPINHRLRAHGKSRYTFFSKLELAILDVVVLFYLVTITKEKLYRIGLAGFFILSCGWIMIVAPLLLSPVSTLAEFLNNPLIQIGFLSICVGWQLRVIEIIGREFVRRHEKAHDFRAKNVKGIYNTAEKEKSMN